MWSNLVLINLLYYTSFCLCISLDYVLLPDGVLQLTEVKQACTAEDFDNTDIAFVTNADDLLKLEEMQAPFRNCTLQRFDDDRDAVLSLLRGKHLVLVGDSLTRYQYLSLVYFIESANWTSDYPNQTWEKDFKSWNHFYQVITTANTASNMCICNAQQCTDTARMYFKRSYISISTL
jgi:GDSL/SGNH-like Acyl-Esterase family found in Pmr5 and Cas1p